MTTNVDNKPQVITIDGINYVRESERAKAQSERVIVRTCSAGVFVADKPEGETGKVMTFKNVCNIWRWRGANTLLEVAQDGVVTSEFTRISKVVPEVTLTEVIEVIPVSEEAAKTLEPVWND